MTVKRRPLALGVFAGTATLLAGPATVFAGGHAALAAPASARGRATASRIEPGAGSWRTWFTPGGSHFQLPAPPAPGAEISQVRAHGAQRDAAALDRISHWDAGAPPYRWIETAIELLDELPDGRRGRIWAYLTGAMHDATVAAWYLKYVHNRPRPSEVDRQVAPVVAVPRSPAYPSEHAAVGAAAADVLATFFPEQAETLRAMAGEAAQTRVQAGVQYPSDAEAGLALGRQVAALAIARAGADGSDTKWDGVIPSGPGHWRGQNPGGVTDRFLKPFVLASAEQLRPPAPPAFDSEQLAAELTEVRDFARTPRSNGIALGHQYSYNGAPGFDIAALRDVSQRVFEAGLEDSPQGARAYAMAMVAFSDAWTATQDAKFHYWAPRPVQLDPALTTVFPTPNHPSYPSNRAAIAYAPAVVLGALFPRDAEHFLKRANQAAESAMWAGIHFRSDIEAAKQIGIAIGKRVVDRDGP
jgi:membrane-associated phospholipid phosphatase